MSQKTDSKYVPAITREIFILPTMTMCGMMVKNFGGGGL